MNREIKFRGKSTLEEERLDYLGVIHDNGWVDGYFVKSGNTHYIIGEVVDTDEDYITPEFWTPVIPETVGQLIGVKDIDGVDIYEGDVCSSIFSSFNYLGIDNRKAYKCTIEVRFEDGQFKAFNVSPKSKKNSRNWKAKHIGNHDLTEIQIIGNIHENPELL